MTPKRAPSPPLQPPSQGLLAAIVESSDDAIISTTLDGIITSWNATAERLFGYSPQEAVGQSVVALLIPDDRKDEENVILERLRRGERIEHFETVRRTKDGRLLDVSLTISPVRDANGEIVGASKIARDITEKNRLERQLRDADRHRIEFLALLAHELRNPLGPIRHAVNILRARTPQPEELEWATNILDRQTEHLTRLVEDLLDVSRITRGTIELHKEQVDITTVLTGAVEVSATLIEKHRHQLIVTPPSEPLSVEGDATRLTQVVMNLLDNAAKYTDSGGRIWLSAEREDDDAVIRVRDTGIGIARDLLPRIFDMFTQAGASVERSQGGLGVGLALVDRLVKLHGGSVSATSGGPGAGSEFTIRLPLAETSHKPAGEAATSEPEDKVAAR
jgi:PAS domain S-box-containing protein